ncbi:hypothetical protein LTR85_002969 [Meristemomyces frigidus]|nr:hypothetical protein LTR85_002969 [Meristemomyces frigidus]
MAEYVNSAFGLDTTLCSKEDFGAVRSVQGHYRGRNRYLAQVDWEAGFQNGDPGMHISFLTLVRETDALRHIVLFCF